MMEKELPKGWVETKISDVSEIIRGITYKKAEAKAIQDDGDFLILRGGNIQDGKIVLSNDAVYVNSDLVKEKQVIKRGDVIIVGSTGSSRLIGKAAFAVEDLPNISFGAFLMMIKPSSQIDARLFNYYFISDNYRNVIRELAGGVNINNIRKEHIENLIFPLPPLPEQKRIVAKLDALFGHLDTLREKLDRIPELLKNFRQQVLTQAVTGRLYHQTYSLKPLGEFAIKIQTGPFGSALHKSDYISNGIPVINPSHIGGGEIRPNPQVSISDDKFEELKAWKLEEGDVVLGRRGEMGRAAKLKEGQEKMLCGTGSIIMRKSNTVNPDFLSIYMRSPFTVSYLESNSVGSTMVNLNQKILKSLPFPDVSESDQSEIVQRVELLFKKADKIEAQYQSLKEKIDQLPQAILAKAFKGELEAQDEDDEPAEVLLERIKGEKNKTIETPRL